MASNGFKKLMIGMEELGEMLNQSDEYFDTLYSSISKEELDEYRNGYMAEELNENAVSSKIPAGLDSFLQDIAQMCGTIDYGDIMDHDYTEDDIRKLNNLRRRFINWAQYDEDDEEVKSKFNEIANKVAEILKRVDESMNEGRNEKDDNKMNEDMSIRAKLKSLYPELNFSDDIDEKLNEEIDSDLVIPAPYDKYFEIDTDPYLDHDGYKPGDEVDYATILAYVNVKDEYDGMFDILSYMLIDDPQFPIVDIVHDRLYPVELPEDNTDPNLAEAASNSQVPGQMSMFDDAETDLEITYNEYELDGLGQLHTIEISGDNLKDALLNMSDILALPIDADIDENKSAEELLSKLTKGTAGPYDTIKTIKNKNTDEIIFSTNKVESLECDCCTDDDFDADDELAFEDAVEDSEEVKRFETLYRGADAEKYWADAPESEFTYDDEYTGW